MPTWYSFFTFLLNWIYLPVKLISSLYDIVNITSSLPVKMSEYSNSLPDCKYKNIVICGGGIMGCSVAYYLAELGIQCTVVERCAIACAASGKAGGFLAKDWCDTYEVGILAKESFEMHAQLAEKLGNIDYRRLDTLSVTTKEGKFWWFSEALVHHLMSEILW